MKIVLMLISLLVAALGAIVLPVLNQTHIVAKTSTSERIRQYYADRARVDRVLDALRRGDVKATAEADMTMQELSPSDERRFAFARVLLDRARPRDAYEVARPKARFGEFSLPNDADMAFYAELATRAGHPEEAAWARERVGEGGHFRVWLRGERYAFASKRGSEFPTGRANYRVVVNLDIDRGLDLYPMHREEIESLRRELLAAP